MAFVRTHLHAWSAEDRSALQPIHPGRCPAAVHSSEACRRHSCVICLIRVWRGRPRHRKSSRPRHAVTGCTGSRSDRTLASLRLIYRASLVVPYVKRYRQT